MSALLSSRAQFISEATYQGKLYLIDYYPGVIASENIDDKVIGDVFGISDPSILKELDHFEGVGASFPQPNEYLRVIQEVTLNDGQKIEAWVYLYNWPVKSKQRIISGDFLTG